MEVQLSFFAAFHSQFYLGILWLLFACNVTLSTGDYISDAHLKCSSLNLAATGTCQSSQSSPGSQCIDPIRTKTSSSVHEWEAAEREGAWFQVTFYQAFPVTKVLIQQRLMESAQIKGISIEFSNDPKIEVALTPCEKNISETNVFSFPTRVTKFVKIKVLSMYSISGGNAGLRSIQIYDDKCDRGYQYLHKDFSPQSVQNMSHSWSPLDEPFLKIYVTFQNQLDLEFSRTPEITSSYRITINRELREIKLSKKSVKLTSSQFTETSVEQHHLWFRFTNEHMLVGSGADMIFLNYTGSFGDVYYWTLLTSAEETRLTFLRPIGPCYRTADYYWLADKVLGGTVVPELHKGLHGTLMGNTESIHVLPYGPLIDGHVSSAIYLEGSESTAIELVKFNQGCLVDLMSCRNGLTIALWLARFGKISTSGNTRLFTLDSPTGAKITISVQPNGQLRLITHTATVRQRSIGLKTLPGKWYHVVVTWHPRDNPTLLVNNEVITFKMPSTFSAESKPDFSYFQAGGDTNSGRVAFRNVALWQRSLSVTEARQIFHCNKYDVTSNGRAINQRVGPQGTGTLPFPEQNVADLKNGAKCSVGQRTISNCDDLISGGRSFISGGGSMYPSDEWFVISFADTYEINKVHLVKNPTIQTIVLSFSTVSQQTFQLTPHKEEDIIFDDQTTSEIQLRVVSPQDVTRPFEQLLVFYDFLKDRVPNAFYNLAQSCSVLVSAGLVPGDVTDGFVRRNSSLSLPVPSNPAPLDSNGYSTVMFLIQFPRMLTTNLLRFWMATSSSDHIKRLAVLFSGAETFTFSFSLPESTSLDVYYNQFVFSPTLSNWIKFYVKETHESTEKRTVLTEVEAYYDPVKDLPASYTLVDDNSAVTYEDSISNVHIGPFHFRVSFDIKTSITGLVAKRQTAHNAQTVSIWTTDRGFLCAKMYQFEFCSVTVIKDNQWHTIQIFYNRGINELSLYIDHRLDVRSERRHTMFFFDLIQTWLIKEDHYVQGIKNFKIHHAVRSFGIGTMEIRDAAIGASSSTDTSSASMARLNGEDGWTYSASDTQPYLQVDLGISSRIAYLGIQSNIVLSINMSYSHDGLTLWQFFPKKIDIPQVAPNTVVMSSLYQTVYGRFLRFHILPNQEALSLRIEVYRFDFGTLYGLKRYYVPTYTGCSTRESLDNFKDYGYKDSPFHFPRFPYDPDTTTPATCQAACNRDGYDYAVLHHGAVCLCTGEVMVWFVDYVSDEHCSSPCVGNMVERCGGKSYVSWYSAMATNPSAVFNPFELLSPPVREGNSSVPVLAINADQLVRSFQEKNIHVNVTQGQVEDIEVSFNGVHYPGLSSGDFTNILTTTGPSYVVAEEKGFHGRPVATAYEKITAVQMLDDPTLSCYRFIEQGTTVPCDARSYWSDLNAKCFVNGQLRFFDMEGVFLGTTGHIIQSYPPVSSNAMTGTTLIPTNAFVKDAKVIAFDFVASKPGRVTIQVFRPECDPEFYCFTTGLCTPQGGYCSWLNRQRTRETFPSTDNLCDPTDAYCPRVSPQGVPLQNLFLVFEKTFEVDRAGLTTVLTNEYVDAGDFLAVRNSDMLEHHQVGSSLYTDSLVLRGGLYHLSLSQTSMQNSTPLLRAHYLVQSYFEFRPSGPEIVYCHFENTLNSFYDEKSILPYNAISGFLVSHPTVYLTGYAVQFVIPPHDGGYITYVIQYGDGYEERFERPSEYDHEELVLTHVYDSPGKKTFLGTALNKFGNVTLTHEIEIIDRIVCYSWSGSVYGQPNQTVRFSWYVTKGQNVTAAVNYGDGFRDTVGPFNGRSRRRVEHAYAKPGTYRMHVKLTNPVGYKHLYANAYIFIPVKNLSVYIEPASNLVNTPVVFLAKITQGSSPSFSAVFRCPRTGSEEHRSSFVGGRLETSFATPCVYEFTLDVENEISSESRGGTIKIDTLIVGDLAVNVEPSAPSEPAVFVTTMEHGVEFQRCDFNCTWDFGDSVVAVTESSTWGEPVSHIYPTSGTYNVTLLCTNEHSSKNTTVEATVVERITYAQITVGANNDYSSISGSFGTTGNAFPFGDSITFNIAHDGTKVTLVVHFGDQSDPLTTTNTSLDHLFSAPGVYAITVKAANVLGHKTASISVSALSNVHNIAVSSESLVKVGTNATFVVTIGQRGTAACYHCNLGDGADVLFKDESDTTCVEPIPALKDTTIVQIMTSHLTTVTFTHNYTNIGTYHVTCTGSNAVSRATSTTELDVVVALCNKPEVSIENLGQDVENPREILRSHDFEILAGKTIDCEVTSLTQSSWRISRVDDVTGENYNDVTGDQMMVEARSLAYGLYNITVTLSMVGVEFISGSSSFGFLEIIPSPPVAEVYGGTSRTVGFNKVILLDGRASRNPDEEDGNFEGMSFYWLCKRDTDNFMFTADPVLETTEAQLKEQGGCFGNGPGRLNYSTSSSVINLDTGLMLVNTTYNIRLVVTRYNRSSFFDLFLTVIQGNPPTISVICLKNCFPQFNPSMKVSMGITCSDCGPSTSLDYRWSLFVDSDDGWILVENLEDAILTRDMSSPNFVIKDGALAKNRTYKIRAEAWRLGGAAGLSEVTRLVNMPPSGGLCWVSPRVGFAMDTLFSVQCEGWLDDNLPLKYGFSYISGSGGLETTLFVGESSKSPNFTFPVGENVNNTLDVLVSISNSVGSTTSVKLTAQVKPSTLPKESLMAKFEDLASANGTIQTLVASGDTAGAMHLISTMCSMMNSQSTISDGTQGTNEELTSTTTANEGSSEQSDKETQIRTNLVNIVAKFDVRTLDEAYSTSSILYLITKKPSQVSAEAQDVTASKLNDVADVLVVKADESETDPKFVEKSAEAALSGFANVLSAGFPVADTTPGVDLYNFDEEFNSEGNDGQSGSLGDSQEAKSKSDVEEEKRKEDLTDSFMSAILGISNAITRNKAPGETPTRLHIPGLSLEISREKSEDMDNKALTAGQGSFILPNLGSLLNGADVVDVATLATDTNPYPEAAITISSSVMTTELRNESGVIQVSNLQDPIDIRLPHLVSPTLPSEPYEIHAIKMNSHKFRVTRNHSAITIDFHVIGNCSERANFSLFLRKGEKPSAFTHDFNITIPDLRTDNRTKNPNTFFLSNVDFNYSTAGLYYLGVSYNRPDGCPGVINYTLDFYTSGCLYWNLKEKAWKRDGCWVGPLTKLTETQCFCNHLTSFGGDFAVAPNTIDWSAVAAGFSNLGDNPVVFATVMAIIGLYFILLIWTRRLDKKDLEKFVSIPLPDNDPRDTYNYEVVVHTGHSNRSGTTAQVTLVIVGNADETEPRALVDPSNTAFKPGGVDNFILSVPSSLGRLSHVRVWHDNTGESPSWYLSRILIRDLQTDRKVWFLCDQWLAVEEDDGLIERILPAATKDDLVSFNFLFSIEARRKLFDDHLWFSVLARRPRSQFTRAQRLSCCLSVMLSSMLANAMFYQGDVTSSSGTEIQAGPIVFSAKQLWIAFISSLVVLPANLLIVYIFRNVRPRNTGSSNVGVQLPGGTEDTPQEDNQEVVFIDSSAKTGCSKGSLPPRFVYVAYLLVFLTVSVSATFTIFYGFTFGKAKSERWISSTMLSFFQDLLLSQPLKVFAMAMFIALILKDPNKVDQGDKNVDKRELKEQLDEVESLPTEDHESQLMADSPRVQTRRPHTARTVIKPPSEEALIAVRELRQKQKKMRGIVSEICWYLAYMTLISVVAYGNRDPKAYEVTRAMNDMFVENKYSSKLSFSVVNNIPNYWLWLYDSVLPALSTPYWYGPYGLEDLETSSKTSGTKSRRGKAKAKSTKTKSSGGSGSSALEVVHDYPSSYTADRAVSFIVGQARMRQLRNSRHDSCTVHPAVEHFQQACSKEYSWSNEDEGCYDVSWRPVNESTEECRKSNPDSHWTYHTAWELKGTPFWGMFHNYWGGGFVVNLGSNLSELQEEAKRLRDEDWVDEQTRAVFLEFTIYNGFTNFFSVVTLLIEKQITGGIYPHGKVNTLRLYHYVGPEAFVTLVCEIIFVGVLCYNFVRELKEARSRGIKSYFKDPWNYFDILGLVFSLTAVALYFVRIAATSVSLKNMKDDRASFVSFHYISAIDESFTSIMAIAIFVYFLKLLRLLRFNRKISMLSVCLISCTETLIAFFFVYMLLFNAYAQLMYSVYGRDLEEYSSYASCLSSLMEMTLGVTDFDGLFNVNRVLTAIVFFSYTFLNTFVYMNLFISIISEKFSEVRADASLQPNDYEIVDFMILSLKKVFGSRIGPSATPIYKEPKDDLELAVEKIGDSSDCVQLALQSLCREEIRQTLWWKDQRKIEEKKILMSILLETGESWTENDIGDAIPLFDEILSQFSKKALLEMRENLRRELLDDEDSENGVSKWLTAVNESTNHYPLATGNFPGESSWNLSDSGNISQIGCWDDDVEQTHVTTHNDVESDDEDKLTTKMNTLDDELSSSDSSDAEHRLDDGCHGNNDDDDDRDDNSTTSCHSDVESRPCDDGPSLRTRACVTTVPRRDDDNGTDEFP